MSKSNFRLGVGLGLGAVAVALLGASLINAADRRPREKPPGRSPKPRGLLVQQDPLPPAIVVVPETPRPFFEVWSSSKDLKPEEQRVFELVRDTLTNLQFIPEHRAKHFSWLEANNLRATAWAADLTKAEPIENGYLVTLRIIPRVGSPTDAAIGVTDWSFERYRVFNDKTWDFVDGTTPPGTGQPGWIME